MQKWNLLLNPVNNLEILSESIFGISVRKVNYHRPFQPEQSGDGRHAKQKESQPKDTIK